MITIIIPWTVATVEKPLFIFTENERGETETPTETEREKERRNDRKPTAFGLTLIKRNT